MRVHQAPIRLDCQNWNAFPITRVYFTKTDVSAFASAVVSDYKKPSAKRLPELPSLGVPQSCPWGFVTYPTNEQLYYISTIDRFMSKQLIASCNYGGISRDFFIILFVWYVLSLGLC